MIIALRPKLTTINTPLSTTLSNTPYYVKPNMTSLAKLPQKYLFISSSSLKFIEKLLPLSFPQTYKTLSLAEQHPHRLLDPAAASTLTAAAAVSSAAVATEHGPVPE